jgi:hypothetical protein
MTSTTRETTGSRPMGRVARQLLAVDLPESYRGALPRRIVDPAFDTVTHLRYSELSPTAFKQLEPDTVVAPLLTKDFDAVELAEYLATLQFTGLLIIVSDVLPNVSIVKREVSRTAPGLTMELYELHGETGLRGV